MTVAPPADAWRTGPATGPTPDPRYDTYDAFADWGVHALTTTRAAGSFGTASSEPAAAVLGRWDDLQQHVALHGVSRLATARQVHGAHVIAHAPGWSGWLRGGSADGHAALARGTAMAVTVADCVPVFVAHPSGATALLHSGWRGTVANILAHAVGLLAAAERAPADLRVLLGPSICGRCYEVSPDVYGRLTGRAVEAPTLVDLRAVIADQARALGVRTVLTTGACTRCDNDRFYSHRAGDPGRQVGVLYAPELRDEVSAA